MRIILTLVLVAALALPAAAADVRPVGDLGLKAATEILSDNGFDLEAEAGMYEINVPCVDYTVRVKAGDYDAEIKIKDGAICHITVVLARYSI